MKSSKLLLSAILSVTCFIFIQSCNEGEDTDSKYLYLPENIVRKDSTKTTITQYIYDESKRLTAIINFTTADSTYTLIKYDVDSNPLEMNTNAYRIRNNTATLQYSYTRTFTYNGSEVVMSINGDNDSISTLTIGINDKLQAIKRTLNNTNKTLTYQYDSNGDIAKTIETTGAESVYTYDNKRGIFREANIPHWFITAVMDLPLDKISINIGEHHNISNNCTQIRITELIGDSTAVSTKTYSYTYGGFSYPTKTTDNNGYTSAIHYIATK